MDPVVEIFFEEAAELLADFEAGLLELEESHGDAELLNRIFRAAHTIKGNAGMLGFEELARFTHGLEFLLEQIRSGARSVTTDVIEALLSAADVVRRMLRTQQTGAEPSTTEIEVAQAVLDRLQAAPVTHGQVATADRHHPKASARPTAGAQITSIRVPIAKVDRLINLVSELVTTQSIVAQGVANFSPDRLAALAESVAQMDRHARALHEHVLAVRMIPVRSLFASFPRLVRDVAAALDKEAVLEISGEDTELDRTVIERIGDPLTHLIRNAVDHGLEPPEERTAAGKPAAGRIRLNAYQQGGNIYIEVSDDGRGLDRDRIVAKAERHGLIAPGHQATDAEVWALIFQPGFSTAEAVTQVSGRGVGMDVVRENVEALGGIITIDTESGRGTSFRIKLPLTLAILDGQAIRVGSQEYIIPLVAIRETIRPERGSVHTVGPGAELVVVHGKPLPVLRLHRVFGVTPGTEDPARGLLMIVEYDGRLAALLVDELLSQQQVVIKSLEANFIKVDGVAGATILGDGRVALILDVAGLIALANTDSARLRAVA
ncbi:MAG TPA: chemotaxis protein CheA [Candidatus Eisenbacteria bacterium]|nr:chemotaxis protein CheA [Candidatus Eisenbacteria bacterium]